MAYVIGIADFNKHIFFFRKAKNSKAPEKVETVVCFGFVIIF